MQPSSGIALREYTVKDVKGFEGLYAITSCGMVYSHSRINRQNRLQKGRFMKQQTDKDGYYFVRLQKDGIATMYRVSRLVALHFLDNPESLPVVNHIDEDRQNNKVSNLEWCTIQYNNEYSKAGTYSLLSPNGCVVTFFNKQKFARDNNLDASHLGHILSGERKSHKGWRFAS